MRNVLAAHEIGVKAVHARQISCVFNTASQNARRIFMRAARRADPHEGAIRMTFDLILAGLVALGLLAYLTAVLIRPERF
jgi:K+-transporting ATPase KdpF subunit